MATRKPKTEKTVPVERVEEIVEQKAADGSDADGEAEDGPFGLLALGSQSL